MRTLDGRLLADLNDNLPALVTGSVSAIPVSDINENTTTYTLLPERVNAVPFISSSIYNTSTPQIKPIQFNDPEKQNLFVDSQGVVKVAVGTSFVLRLRAMQPPVYNVENGVPTMLQDQTGLIYEWQKDGSPILLDDDRSRPNSYVFVTGENGNELTFSNTSAKYRGTYTCTVTNDIGTVESEPIVLEVYNPDIEDTFYKNLIANPYGKDGTNEWQTPDTEFTVGRLSDLSFEGFSQPWRTDLAGYSKDMFYPRPYHLNTYHIRNSTLTQDITQEGYYFTREKFKYTAKDGKAVVNASYEVDLSAIQEYIQGSIYGIDGVRAIFGCYIGNAMSSYRLSLLNVLISRRSSKYALVPTVMRLSLLNCLLAGVPSKLEELKVTVQEFNGETPLMSTVNGQQTPGTEIYDPWTSKMWEVDYDMYFNDIPLNATIPTRGDDVKIVYIAENNLLYPSQSYIPTYGQYVGFNRLVIDKLNFKTTKVRIGLCFTIYSDIVDAQTKVFLDNSDECFEYNEWEPITRPLKWPRGSNDYVKEGGTGSIISAAWYNQKMLNIPKEEPFRYMTMMGAPRAMATGFNLVLLPMESGSQNKLDYYTRTILTPTENPQARVNELTYPDLKSGTTPATSLGLYFGGISDYDYQIVGVDIKHRYNLPYNNNDKGTSGTTYILDADGKPASRTTVTTYLYNKSHSLDVPNVFNFTTGTGSIWMEYALKDLPVFKQTAHQTASFIVLYSSESVDVTSANLAQVIGNIETGTIKYTNNLVVDIPGTFVTTSIQKRDYVKNMAVNLGLTGADLGVPTTSQSIAGKTPEEAEAQRISDWRKLSGSAGELLYNYNLIQAVDNLTSANTYVENDRASQHLLYSTAFDSSWGGTWPYNGNDNKLYIGDSFAFQTSSRYESLIKYVGTHTTSPTYNWTMADAIQFAKQRAELSYNVGNILFKKKINGLDVDMREIISKGTTSQSISYNSFFNRNEYSATYEIVARCRSLDHIKLNSVITNNMNTPTAIVIPELKRIVYFIYNYTDNVLNEVV